MKKYVIIVAGGSGSRMNEKIPKQFLELCGMPILMHTILAFNKCSKEIEIVLVLPEHYIEYWVSLCEQYKFTVPVKIQKGGDTRLQSVKKGLEMVIEDGLVAVHDGARPLVTNNIITEAYEKAAEFGSAVPVIPLKDSIRKVAGTTSKALDRSEYRLVQTPQVFQSFIIKKAYNNISKDINCFTDDASVVEGAGYAIYLVNGASENIKITDKKDLTFASFIIRNSLLQS